MTKENLKVSLVIAVYKDIDALELIMSALKTQTYKNFEVIVAEDNNSDEMKKFLSGIEGLEIKHTSQEDLGIRKTRSLNNAILASTGEYLVFIDGDCIPYSTFIESHAKLAEPGYVVSGRRVNLGPKYSKKIRNKILTPLQLEKTYLKHYLLIALDAVEKHAEAGFQFSTDSFYYRIKIKNKKNVGLLGCNYSCYRSDMIKINGYDEGYGETAVGDDTDLEWRFKGIGLKLKSAKNIANIFHLYHDRGFRFDISADNELKKMEENKNKKLFHCVDGLDKH